MHLNPVEHKDIYSAAIHKNLSSKYNVFYESDRHDFIQTSVTIVSGIRQKLITIKEGKDSETKIKGFLYTFKVEGDPDLIRNRLQMRIWARECDGVRFCRCDRHKPIQKDGFIDN